MTDPLSLIGIIAFGWLAYAFWYAGHDVTPAQGPATAPGKNLVS